MQKMNTEKRLKIVFTNKKLKRTLLVLLFYKFTQKNISNKQKILIFMKIFKSL